MKQIILNRFLALFILLIATIQNVTGSTATTITGVVTDAADNSPLIGVSILIKGTTNGTVTDENGKYSLEVPNAETILVFSFVGYPDQELTVGTKTILNITMNQGVSLAQVVVVGYGTQKRSDVTGSVTTVGKERLSDLPVSNVLQAIEGSVAGVNITQASSVPGAGVNALIRGTNSISASTGPFIVVDGIPFSTTGGSLNDINTNDIESMEILKDASAVAIYGTRGANGVILITTKRGKSGKPVIRYSTYFGTEDVSHVVDPMGADQYVQKYADWKAQSGSTDVNKVPNAYEQANLASGTTTNWLDQIRQTGSIQNHSLSISGGTEDVHYFISGDYLNQNGVIKGYQYNRYSLRSNLDANITSFLKAGLNVSFSSNNSDGGRANLNQAMFTSPYGTFKRANGDYEIYPMFGELLYTNPLLGTTTQRNDRSQNINANTYLEVSTPIKGLKYRANFGYSVVPTLYQSYAGRPANDLLGTAVIGNSQTKNWVLENVVTYSKEIGKNNIGITALYSAQENTFSSDTTTAVGFINDALQFNNISAAASASGTSNAFKTNLLSQMVRLNYSYDSRYLLTITARRDGYSAFGSNTSKYGTFPSVALGWNIANEAFMKNSNLFSSLKLRVSYGLSGNQAIGPNSTTSTDGTVKLPFNGVTTIGVLANILGNKNLTWESTAGTNIGVDFGLYKDRITGSIEAYSTETKDLLLYRSLPTITGYNRVLDNLGTVSNKGIELTLRTRNIVKGDFKWESNLNFAANQNLIVDLYGDKKDDVANGWFIGQPISAIYDYQKVGVWQTGESAASQDPTAKPGDLKFQDTNGSKTITADDKVIQGQSTPKWIGGLTNTFHYKNFSLNVFIQTVQGITRYNTLLNIRDQGGRQNIPAVINYWTAANGSNDFAGIAYNNTRLYQFPQDASFTRIKDVTFSYSMPQNILDKIHLGGLNLYVSGRNLATLTNWIGWDPEADYNNQLGGTNLNNYPLVKTFVFGANITLR